MLRGMDRSNDVTNPREMLQQPTAAVLAVRHDFRTVAGCNRRRQTNCTRVRQTGLFLSVDGVADHSNNNPCRQYRVISSRQSVAIHRKSSLGVTAEQIHSLSRNTRSIPGTAMELELCTITGQIGGLIASTSATSHLLPWFSQQRGDCKHGRSCSLPFLKWQSSPSRSIFRFVKRSSALRKSTVTSFDWSQEVCDCFFSALFHDFRNADVAAFHTRPAASRWALCSRGISKRV